MFLVKKLSSEAEWEYAARGGLVGTYVANTYVMHYMSGNIRVKGNSKFHAEKNTNDHDA